MTSGSTVAENKAVGKKLTSNAPEAATLGIDTALKIANKGITDTAQITEFTNFIREYHSESVLSHDSNMAVNAKFEYEPPFVSSEKISRANRNSSPITTGVEVLQKSHHRINCMETAMIRTTPMDKDALSFPITTPPFLRN
jgi:hypothetical protein